MPLVTVTDELVQLIKDERKKNKVSGEVLGEAIKKSRAYISQIENGKIPMIELEVLEQILKVITKLNDEEFNIYIQELLKKIAVPVSLNVMQKEEWMFVFDLQVREFEIPNALIDFIVTKCKELNLSYEELTNIINENKELPYSNTYEPNKLKVIIQKGAVGWAIRFKLQHDYIAKILKKEITNSNYVNLLGIVYNILELEGNTPEDAKEKAEKLLEENEIITILDRNKKRDENIKKKIEAGEDFQLEDTEVTEYDKRFKKAYKRVDFYIGLLNDRYPSEAYTYLEHLADNFETDKDLMYAILSMPIYKFKPLPISEKKEFFKELKDIVKKYCDKAKEYDGDIEYK